MYYRPDLKVNDLSILRCFLRYSETHDKVAVIKILIDVNNSEWNEDYFSFTHNDELIKGQYCLETGEETRTFSTMKDVYIYLRDNKPKVFKLIYVVNLEIDKIYRLKDSFDFFIKHNEYNNRPYPIAYNYSLNYLLESKTIKVINGQIVIKDDCQGETVIEALNIHTQEIRHPMRTGIISKSAQQMEKAVLYLPCDWFKLTNDEKDKDNVHIKSKKPLYKYLEYCNIDPEVIDDDEEYYETSLEPDTQYFIHLPNYDFIYLPNYEDEDKDFKSIIYSGVISFEIISGSQIPKIRRHNDIPVLDKWIKTLEEGEEIFFPY